MRYPGGLHSEAFDVARPWVRSRGSQAWSGGTDRGERPQSISQSSGRQFVRGQGVTTERRERSICGAALFMMRASPLELSNRERTGLCKFPLFKPFVSERFELLIIELFRQLTACCRRQEHTIETCYSTNFVVNRKKLIEQARPNVYLHPRRVGVVTVVLYDRRSIAT